jgi:hypothetical protein
MGFFSKIFKGVKKVFKKIGRGIKKVFKKVGKFMGKIGIVGQIALSFLLPGVGALIGKAAGAMMASSSAIVSGAGSFLNAAVNIGAKAGSLVKSVSDGVLKVVGKTIGTAINKIPGAGNFLKQLTSGKIDITQMKNFTGPGGIMDTVQKAASDVASKGGDLFSMDTLTKENVFSQQAKIAKGLEKYAQPLNQAATEVTPEAFQEKILAGETPMEAGFDLKSTVGQIKAPELEFALPTEDAFARSMSTGQADYFDFAPSTQQPASLLSAPEIPTLSAEQLASGYEYTVAGVTAPPQTLTDKFFETRPGQAMQAKATEAAGKLTKANVARALTETGMSGDTYTGGTYAVADIDPEAEQYAVNQTSLGAEGTRRTIQRMEVTGFRGTDPNLIYQPQSSWANNLAGLLQGQPVGSVA